MIPRYTLPEMAAVWSDQARMDHWLEIEILAVEGWAEIGRIPEEAAREVRAKAAFTVGEVLAMEEVTRHDVAAFVDVVARSVGEAGRWLHFGLTSSDVLDTALALQMRDAVDILLDRLEQLLAVTRRQALANRDTVCVGRSHGIVAEPSTLGHKFALWAFELDRGRRRLRQAREVISVGAVSGPIGTYSNIDPRIEVYVCEKLGLAPAPASSQVIQRDRHAEYTGALALVASSLDRFATEIRHLARTEVREVQEPFATGQKGSSAMPHKRNPVVCERITGLARVIRGNHQAALENIALWHERDISHSSAERVILPDSTMALDFMLKDFTWVLDGLVVFPDRMLENLNVGGGLVFSQGVLLALVDSGLSRDDAYRIVQESAAKAWDAGGDFKESVRAAAGDRISADDLEALFEPARSLGNLGGVFERVEQLEVKG